MKGKRDRYVWEYNEQNVMTDDDTLFDYGLHNIICGNVNIDCWLDQEAVRMSICETVYRAG